MSTRSPFRRLLMAAVALAPIAGACGDDDGASVRDLGEEESSASESGSASGSASASASGSASASAPASGSASGTAGEGDGGYEYATDPGGIRLLSTDMWAVSAALDADPRDFDTAASVYTEGDAATPPLAEWVEEAAPEAHAIVTDALAGTGDLADASDGVRRQAAQKGIQNQGLVAVAASALTSAADAVADGDTDMALAEWDTAWAAYHGADPGCAPYATADSRAGNFGTVGDDGETALANEAILAAMLDGRSAIEDGDAEGVDAAITEVVRNLVITYSQAAVRYATLVPDDLAADDAATAAEHQMEGWVFFGVIEDIVADAGADTEAVAEVLDPALNAPGDGGAGTEVRIALEPAWEALGITDADIGELS